MKKLWLIAVDAPELEQLRQNYGLSPLLKNHNFHITLGAQVPGKPQVKCLEFYVEEEELEREAA